MKKKKVVTLNEQDFMSLIQKVIDKVKNFSLDGDEKTEPIKNYPKKTSNFGQAVDKIIDNFEIMNLDLLLLGYLTQYTIDENHSGIYLKGPKSSSDHPFSYYSFPDSIWGAQMYMLSRTQAYSLLLKYSPPYADLSMTNNSMNPFNSDWTITKEGNRALIYPMVALEDGKTKYEDMGQYILHQDCHKSNYVNDLFYE
jgi:hypothetical protein